MILNDVTLEEVNNKLIILLVLNLIPNSII